MAAYATAAAIRSVEQTFADTDEFEDATLTGWSTLVADPEIDARLKSAGFTTPVAAPHPSLIVLIAAMLSAAHGLDSYIGQRTSEPIPRATKLREDAREMLDRIDSGVLDTGLTRSAAGAPILIDSDPETFPATATIVGDETTWTRPTEDREDA